MPYIIKVPKPSRAAYNPDRPLEKNLLIKAQVEHFREAEINLPPELHTGIDIAEVKTEGQASTYIQKVTRAIHQNGGRAIPKVEPAR